jgi:HemK-related putative methylase
MEYDPSIIIEDLDTVYPVSEDSIFLIRSLNVSSEKVLEIGCGSGVVSLHCVKNGCSVVSVDINPNAVNAAKHNAGINGMELEVRESDVYSNVDGRFDLIIFNLPYLPENDEGLEAKAWSGGPDGIGPLPKLLNGLCEHLTENGRLVIVISSLMEQLALGALLEGYSVKTLGMLPLFFEQLYVLEIRALF